MMDFCAVSQVGKRSEGGDASPANTGIQGQNKKGTKKEKEVVRLQPKVSGNLKVV